MASWNNLGDQWWVDRWVNRTYGTSATSNIVIWPSVDYTASPPQAKPTPTDDSHMAWLRRQIEEITELAA